MSRSDLQNTFFQKSERERRKFQFRLLAYAALILLPLILISLYLKIYFLPFILIWILLSILAPFFDTPSLVKRKKLKYYSPLLLVEEEKNNNINIHGGTLFDYYFTLDKSHSGIRRKTWILQQYLEGLLELIKDLKNSDNPDLVIQGTTYIISERTGRKLGFTPEKPDFIQTVVLIFNYPNLLLSKSLANKRISLPRLSNIRTFKIKFAKLLENESQIEKLNILTKAAMADHRET
jgi:hypothetical protein